MGRAIRLEPQAAYALWAPTYPPRPHNQLMEVEQAAMLELLPDVTGKTALDAGCGTGRYLQLLKDRRARAVGIDCSTAMLSRVTAASALIRGDLYALPLGTGSVDVAICGLALGDVADLDVAVGELGRVLRPGGQLLYSVVHPDGGPAGWTRSFDTAEGQREVAGYWHSRADHQRALASAGLTVTEWREPAIGGQPAALVVGASR